MTQFPPIREQDRNWVRSNGEKTEAFLRCRVRRAFSKVFEPNSPEIFLEEKNRLLSDANTSIKMNASAKSFIVKEMQAAIN